ncbi:rhamnogalacturonate lyase [Xylaria acuta]|nr:rhamnogalacturonate lyase [Xylaria acuta]
MPWLKSKLLALATLLNASVAFLNATETTSQFALQNDRLYVVVSKSNGQVVDIVLDEQDLLGPVSGNTGKGPYVDCSCTPSGAWTPGSTAKFQLIKGTDSTGTPYGGVRMSDTYKPTNQSIEEWWFLREGETGLHLFTRVTYFNQTAPYLRDLGELRTLFRPNTKLWTHLSGDDGNYAPIPSADAYKNQVVVQDAAWYLGKTAKDPYVQQYSDYFTKYTFSELWRDHKVHGQYADGTTSSDGNTYGAWLVHNTRETYYGGPLHYDLVVDGIVYNYLVSGHYGAPVPNMTTGFDKTWGPQYYHFNKGTPDTTLAELRADAAKFADPEWNADFYDSIAKYVPNYAPKSKRAAFKATIQLPSGAKRPIAVLSENKQDFQLNVFDHSSLQYWADISPSGSVEIPMVKAGTYRLTVYADNIFGWFIQDDVTVSATATPLAFEWKPESAGKEVWRIGTPDKSAGEYKHGFAPDTSKPLQPEQYRIYWAKWDFPTDFPDGVVFKVGESVESEDFNYIHWSWFPGYANYVNPRPVYDNVNNWTIQFDLSDSQLAGAQQQQATFTVELAGAKTANGNNKWTALPAEKYSNVPYTVAVNGKDVETWVIPSYRSGSCGVRGGVVCQNFGHKFVFSTELLNEGANEFVLSLPFNATNTETAVLPGVIYIQYDALRLELS